MFSTKKRSAAAEIEGMTFGEFENALRERGDTRSRNATARAYLHGALPPRETLRRGAGLPFYPHALTADFKNARGTLNDILRLAAPIALYGDALIEQLRTCQRHAAAGEPADLVAARCCLQRAVAIAVTLAPPAADREIALRLLRHARIHDAFLCYETARAIAAVRPRQGFTEAELEDWAAHLAAAPGANAGAPAFPAAGELTVLAHVETELLSLRAARAQENAA